MRHFVPGTSPVRNPEDLAGVDIHVGYQSGSHYTTIQSLEPFIAPDQIKLKFGGGPSDRVDQLLNGLAPAATVFGMQYYILEQLDFRKIVDATFMIAAMIPPCSAPEQIV
jgi:NitT/TauT family transport system substrate-binding protein